MELRDAIVFSFIYYYDAAEVKVSGIYIYEVLNHTVSPLTADIPAFLHRSDDFTPHESGTKLIQSSDLICCCFYYSC